MAHGGHGGGGAPTIKPKVSPEMASFLSARLGTEDLPEIDAALAQDEQTKGMGALAQNLSRAASLYRGEKVGAPAVAVPDALRTFVLRKQAEAATRPEMTAPNPDDDPASPVSQAARAALLQTPHGRAVRDSLGDSFEQLPASKLKPLLPMWRASADTKPPTVQKPAESPPDEVDIAEMTKRGIPAGLAKTHGEALDLIGRADQAKAAREGRDAARADREAGRDAREGARDDKKAGQLYAGTFFKFRPDVPAGAIPDSTRSELIDQTGLIADVADASDQLVGLYQKHGNQITGPVAGTMRTLVADIRLVAKSPAIYNLGVLNGPDLDILRGVVDDPTKVDSIFKNATQLRELVTEIGTFRARAIARLTKRWESFGADPIGGPFVKGGDLISEAAALEGGKVQRITRTVNGETRVWNGSAWVKE